MMIRMLLLHNPARLLAFYPTSGMKGRTEDQQILDSQHIHPRRLFTIIPNSVSEV